MTNITIQLTLLRDGKTWRAAAEATGHAPVTVESIYPGVAAMRAAGQIAPRVPYHWEAPQLPIWCTP